MKGEARPRLVVRIARGLARRAARPSIWSVIEVEMGEEVERRQSEGASRRSTDRWLTRQYLGLWGSLVWERVGSFDFADARGGRVAWARDLRLAWRGLVARPGLALSVITTVALAIGATTSVYSVVHGVLLRPLQYPEADRLVSVWLTRHEFLESPNEAIRAFGEGIGPDAPVFDDWADADVGFAALGAYREVPLVVQERTGPEAVRAGMATAGLFTTLGVEPALGRAFAAEDDRVGAGRVVVLADGYWRTRFGGDPEALGSAVTIGGVPHTVVGVMPPSFTLPREPFPYPGLPPSAPAFWTPLSDDWRGGGTSVSVVGRLGPGVSLDEAEARLASLHEGLVAGGAHQDIERTSASLQPLVAWIVGDVKQTLWFLLAGVGLVLLVATVNITNMLVASGLSRQREFAVRSALGAGGPALVRSQLVESGVMAGVGGLAGLGLATLGQEGMLRWIPASVPRAESIETSATVLVVGLAITGLAALAVGVLPALVAGRVDPQSTLGGSTRGSTMTRSARSSLTALAVVELAIAFVLLVGAGLLGNSYARLSNVPTGLDASGLLVVTVIPDPDVHAGREGYRGFMAALQTEVQRNPGLRAAAMNTVPLSGTGSFTPVEILAPNGEGREVFADIVVGQVGALDILGVPVLEGRVYDATDVTDALPVALITASMQRKHWPDGALGQRISLGNEDEEREIVGVVADVRSELDRPPEEMVILPSVQARRGTNDWVLFSAGDRDAGLAAFREALRTVSPTTPVRDVRVLETAIEDSIALPRLRALLIGALAVLAAILALSGVYGVLAFSVARRTKEIGIRMALGARSGRVVSNVVRSGLRMAIAGTLGGLFIAAPLASWSRSFLFEIAPYDPVTYVGVSLTVLAVAALASYLPARRAAAIDPIRVLNRE
ncbi:MAG: ADOP family duplicated permease [Gemmatimonadota bacterium]